MCGNGTFNYRFVTTNYRVAGCAICGLLTRQRPPEEATESERSRWSTARPLTEVERSPWLHMLGKFAPADTLLELGAVPSADGPVRWMPHGRPVGAIAAWDVLSYTARPDSFLEDVHRALLDNGLLLLTLPASDSESARTHQRQWPALSAGYNWLFDRVNLQTLLFKLGFDHISLWSTGELVTDARDALTPVNVPGGLDLAVLARKRPTRTRFKVSIIVPVYNEHRTFAELMRQLRDLELDDIDKEIIIVESNSTDGTKDEVRELESEEQIRVIWQDKPRGKGFAVRAGLSIATGDFIIIQDADLEYDLNDYSILLDPLVCGRQAFVIGSRHAQNGWKMRTFTDARMLASFFNIGHILFTALVNVLFDQKLADPFSMFKVFRRDCLHGLSFECNRFDFDYELLIKLIRKGYQPVEIPVNYESRSFADGKKVSVVRDPLTWLRALYRYRTLPLRNFLSRPLLY